MKKDWSPYKIHTRYEVPRIWTKTDRENTKKRSGHKMRKEKKQKKLIIERRKDKSRDDHKNSLQKTGRKAPQDNEK